MTSADGNLQCEQFFDDLTNMTNVIVDDKYCAPVECLIHCFNN